MANLTLPNLRARVGGIRGAQDLESLRIQAAAALTIAQDALDVLTRKVALMATEIGGTVMALQIVSSIDLAAATTEITSPSAPTEGAHLTVVITQDATGGRAITWSADFVAFTTDIAPFPNKKTVFFFTGLSDGTWLQTGDPLREV